MDLTRSGRVLLVASIAALALAGCQDRRTGLVDPQMQAGKACPPGQVDKGCSIDPPPPPPVNYQLPAVFLDRMVSPLRVDRTPWGWLLLTDSQLRMVLRVDPVSLQPIQGIETNGKPLGVAGMGGAIYVGDVSNRTVAVYGADGGNFRKTFGPGAVEYPADMAADPAQSLLFVLDGKRREVRVFDASGSLVRTISGPGTLADQLTAPTALGLDPARQWVMVSDYGQDGGYASLKIFGYDGTLVRAISGQGKCGMLGCSGGFSRPQGASVDAAGRLYMPDALLAQVFVFDPATWAITSVLGGNGAFSVPTDVTVDAAGDLFVVCNWSGEMKVLRGVAP